MSNDLYKKLTALGITSSLALGGAYLTAPAEGVILGTYKDPVGIITSCYGRVDKNYKLNSKFTEDECVKQLGEDLIKADSQLSKVVKVEYSSPYQHAALVDFTYNVGITSVKSSTMLKKLNAGNYDGACYELTKWVYAKQDGIAIKLKGLMIRRTNEYKWCMGVVPDSVRMVYEAGE